MTRTAWGLVGLLALAGCGAALAQEAPLGGPRVVEGVRPVTLVVRGYNGLIQRLDTPPEEAALELAEMDGPTREETRRVLAERAAILDRLVLDNLETLVALGAAGDAGNKAEALRLGLDLIAKSEPLRARGRLRDELAGVMPAPVKTRYLAIVDEYWDAIAAEAKAGLGKKGRIGAILEERGRLLGKEIERSFYRQVDPKGEEEFERLLARLELRPEQESKVRHLAEEFIRSAKFRPTKAQEVAFIVRVSSMLDEGQRQRLAEYIGEQAGK